MTDSRVENVPGQAVSFWNNDAEKHNVIWLERVSVQNTGNVKATHPAVGLYLKSAYVLLRNNDIAHSFGRAVHIEYSSETTERVSEATLSQNSLRYCAGGVVITNVGANNASMWLSKNTIRHMVGTTSVVQIINASITADGNLFHNNSGKYILELGNQSPFKMLRGGVDVQPVSTTLPQTFLNNTFWFNVAQAETLKYTVVVNNSKVTFHNNIFSNPANTFEFAVVVEDSSGVVIDCSQNWWGSGILSTAQLKIRDKQDYSPLVAVIYKPILEIPPPHFGLSSE